ncbi:MAG: squalene/phytoene synthase family protein, partial [Paludibacteraceae bacterium]|nr:squalene/phytoene synthase family protein [Paludibacteraceae bacterium]
FVEGDKQAYNNLLFSAKKLGSAFQKVNFLRDLKADFQDLGRVYFPDFSIDSLDESKKHAIIADMESDFIEARKGITELPGKSKLAVYIAYLYFYDLLQKINQTPFRRLLETRIRVSNSRKTWLLAKAYIQYAFRRV